MDQRKFWNESSATIPLDKDPSAYAIEKEKEFPRGSVVCDLGGGIGVDSIYFIQKGHRVILTDISDRGLETARKKAETLGLTDKITLIQKDLSEGELPIEDDLCDVVYSRLSLHYFFPKQLSAIFKEIVRILKPGGVSFIVIKSPKDDEEMKFLKQTAKEIEDGVFNDKGQIKSRYSEQKLGQILESADINNFEIKDYQESFLGHKDRVKSGLNKMLYFEIKIKK